MEILSSTRKREIYPTQALKDFLEKENILKHFSEKDIARLAIGEYSSLIENVHLNGNVSDGKFFIAKDEDTFKLHQIQKSHIIDWPDDILGKKLTKTDHENLFNGKMLGPFDLYDNKMFFRFDKDLNKITLHTAKNIGVTDRLNEIPTPQNEKFGGYFFTDQEQNLIANGKEVGPKVFCADGAWFLGSYSREDKAMEVISKVTIHKPISESEAKKLISVYNNTASKKSDSKLDPIQKEAFFIPAPPVLNEAKSVSKSTTEIHSKSYSIERKSVKLDYNDTFNYVSLTFDKKNGLPEEIFKNSFNQKDLDNLKTGKILENKEIQLKNGDKINANIQLVEVGDKYQLIFIINSHKQKGKNLVIDKSNLYPLQKYSAQDKLVMDLIDQKDFKGLNSIVESGYKPSEDIQKLIYSNISLSDNTKMVVAKTFKTEPDLVNSLHFNQALGTGKSPLALDSGKQTSDIKLSSSKDTDSHQIPSPNKIKNKKEKNGNKHHVLNGLKSMFNDM